MNIVKCERIENLIKRYGGKSASLEFQRLNNNSKYLPPYHLITDFKNSQNQIPNDFFEDGKEYIFRSSAIGDEKGLVGMLPTKTFIFCGDNFLDGRLRKKVSLDELIQDIFQESNSDYIKKYTSIVDRNSNYKGLSSIIVMPFIEGDLKGSITTHPNIENHYILSLFDRNYYFDFLLSKRGELYNTNKDELLYNLRYQNYKITLSPILDKLISMKKSTDRVGLIDSRFSSQTEFTIDSKTGKVYFLQQRKFREFQPSIQYSPQEYVNHKFDDGNQSEGEIEIFTSEENKEFTYCFKADYFRNKEIILKNPNSSFCSIGGHNSYRIYLLANKVRYKNPYKKF